MPTYYWEILGHYEAHFVTVVADSVEEAREVARTSGCDAIVRGDGLQDDSWQTIYERVLAEEPQILGRGEMVRGYYGE